MSIEQNTVTTDQITAIINQLSSAQKQQVQDFAQFLLEKRRSRESGSYTLRQDWAGALREYREEYTSLELQQKALEWRED